MKRPIKKEFFLIDSEDGLKIQCYRWYSKQPPYDKICIIAHGMSDHAQRYEDLAGFLCENGIAVYALDLRGHGETAKETLLSGHLSDNNGWEKTVSDIKKLSDLAKKQNRESKIFLLGHSMGEMLIRDLIMDSSDSINGVILLGVAADPGIVKLIGKITASVISLFKGKRHKSLFLTKMLFGKYNRSFGSTRTSSDWISSIDKEVDKYISDPCCNIIFTSGFFQDLNRGFERINNTANIKKIRKDLPVYILSGKEDAVGNKSRGAAMICDSFKGLGLKDVTCKIYEDTRHEIINDISRQQAYDDIKNWIEKHSE